MLEIKFEGLPMARAIILEKPVHVALSGKEIAGMIECTICECKAGLFHEGGDQLADAVEQFIKTHECLPLARLTEADAKAFAANLQRELPNALVSIKKKRNFGLMLCIE